MLYPTTKEERREILAAAVASKPSNSRSRAFAIVGRAEISIRVGFASLKTPSLNHCDPLLFSEPKLN